ncbi:MAG: response regulator [Chloroflexota bacterium]
MKEKILIVEDNPENLSLMEMILRARDYNLLRATDGEEALAVAVREKPDLIVMDIQLPKLSGLEVTSRLRQLPEFEHLPILAVTAFASQEDEQQTLEAGCDAYLAKPISTRQFPLIIKQMLEKRGVKDDR